MLPYTGVHLQHRRRTLGGEYSFLTTAARDEFDKPGRVVPRLVIKLPTGPAPRDPKSELLTDMIARRMESLQRQQRAWFAAACITVRRDDGMTWSAESVNRFAARRFPTFHRWCLADKIVPESLPLIAHLVGKRRFLKLAVNHKLTTSFVTLRSWMTPLLLAVSLLVGVAGQFAALAFKSAAERPGITFGQVLSNPFAWGAAGVLAALLLLGQYLTTRLSADSESKSLENFLKDLRSNENTPPYSEFEDALAQALRHPRFFPRFVIVDHLEGVDATTRHVIKRYFRKFSESPPGSEFWVVFDPNDGERLTHAVLDNRSGSYGLSQTELYQQVLLAESEKLNLVRLIGRPAHAAEFSLVKSVCRDHAAGRQRLAKLFEEYRRGHPRLPDRYGNLEFLFLLSLTAKPGSVFLRRPFLHSRLTAKGSLPAEVLRRFLTGTAATKEEFDRPLNEILQQFRSVLIIEEEGRTIRFSVTPEAADVLAELPADLNQEHPVKSLDLPDAGLGHLYWALLWHDEWKSRPPQAIWMRKLAFHLQHADLSRVRDSPRYGDLLRQTFEACVFAVDGCLKTCLFTEVHPLIERAVSLLQSDFPGYPAAEQRRLLRECWRAYSVLGDEAALTSAVDLLGLARPEIVTDASTLEAPPLPPLAGFFLQGLPLTSVKRSLLQSALTSPAGRGPHSGPSPLSYAQAQGAWLAITAATFLGDWSGGIAQSLAASTASLPGISNAALERIQLRLEDGVRVTDVLTLSASLWCQALQLHPQVRDAASRASVAQARPAAAPGVPPRDAFAALLDAAERAVQIAAALHRESSGPAADAPVADFLITALARELCAASLCSLLAACHLLRHDVNLLDDPLWQRIPPVFRAVTDLFDYPFPALSQPPDLFRPAFIEAAERFQQLCAVVWHVYELERLRDFLNLRRIQFHSICRPMAPEQLESYRPLLDAVAPAIQARDLRGLLANLAVAASLHSAAELSTHYLRHAGAVALQEDFDPRLRHEMSLLVLAHTHHLGVDLEPFLEDLLAPEVSGATFLAGFLETLPPSAACTQILGLLNASDSRAHPETAARVRAVVDSLAPRLSDPDAARLAVSLIQMNDLAEAVAAGRPVDFDAQLAAWADRRDLWPYPSLLRHALQAGAGPGLGREAAALLERDATDNVNTYHLLALTLASRSSQPLQPGDDRRSAVRYLKGSIGRWESASSAEHNLGVYQTLLRLDPSDRARYEEQILRWHTVQIERDHLQRFPEMAQQGLFFLIFLEYFRTMLFWGLPLDLSPDDYQAHIRIPGGAKLARVNEWKAAGARVPAPIHSVERRHVLSAEFLYLGESLFTAPNDRDPGLAPERDAFNEAAKGSLEDLLRLIVGLPGLPPAISGLLRSYSGRLYRYSLPPDAVALRAAS